MFYGMVYYCTNNEWMPMILQTKIYSSLVYHNSFFFLLFSGSTLFESVELAVFFQKEVMIYTAKGAKETCRPPADCIILSIGSVKVTKTRNTFSNLIKVGIVWKEERNVTIQCSWSISCDDGSNSKWKKRRMLVKSCHPRWYRYFFFLRT